ncbi:MAG: hypothetical protein U1A72_13320 [Sulfuritalea sp.]|nr:hypothetical protein [Sulfuritalea sp.]
MATKPKRKAATPPKASKTRATTAAATKPAAAGRAIDPKARAALRVLADALRVLAEMIREQRPTMVSNAKDEADEFCRLVADFDRPAAKA